MIEKKITVTITINVKYQVCIKDNHTNVNFESNRSHFICVKYKTRYKQTFHLVHFKLAH